MSDSPIHLVGLCGSLRRGSYNAALLRAAVELLPDGVTLEIGEHRDFPPYDADLQDRGVPEPVRVLSEKIAACDGALIASPEYNYSVPGGLKNAIDWVSRDPKQPFAGKALGIIGASPGGFGTVRMQGHLRQIAVFLDLMTVNTPQVLVSQAKTKFSDEPEPRLTDEPTRKVLRAHLEALAKLARRLKSAR